MAKKIDGGSVGDLLDQVSKTLMALNQTLQGGNGQTVAKQAIVPGSVPPEMLAAAGMISLKGLTEPGADEASLRALAQGTGLGHPIERLIEYRNAGYPDSRPRHWGVVNFDLHSSKPRLFVLDVVAATVESYLCAHGIGSEVPSHPGFAEMFSNIPDSKTSSLGIYRCAETYISTKNGYSLQLDGLQDTNSNARSRAIVMHGADYVSNAFVAANGRVGRSEGCPALDRAVSAAVIDQLKFGSFLLHWQTP